MTVNNTVLAVKCMVCFIAIGTTMVHIFNTNYFYTLHIWREREREKFILILLMISILRYISLVSTISSTINGDKMKEFSVLTNIFTVFHC